MWPFAKRIEMPSKEWYSEGVPSYTPDVPFLETRPFWRVFVCDELMTPHFMHQQLGDDAEKRIDAFTMDKFSLWKKDQGNASQIIPLEIRFSRVPFLHIRGQLWKVSTPRLLVLDSMKENGVEFLRKRVRLAIPYHYAEINGEETTTRRFMDTSLMAWMYIGNDDVWKPRLLKGTKLNIVNGQGDTTGRIVDGRTFIPVRSFVPKNPLLAENYYYYARTEYLIE